jgi:hypothetical protein
MPSDDQPRTRIATEEYRQGWDATFARHGADDEAEGRRPAPVDTGLTVIEAISIQTLMKIHPAAARVISILNDMGFEIRRKGE